MISTLTFIIASYNLFSVSISLDFLKRKTWDRSTENKSLMIYKGPYKVTHLGSQTRVCYNIVFYYSVWQFAKIWYETLYFLPPISINNKKIIPNQVWKSHRHKFESYTSSQFESHTDPNLKVTHLEGHTDTQTQVWKSHFFTVWKSQRHTDPNLKSHTFTVIL